MRFSSALLLVILAASCTTAQLDLPSDAWAVEGANPRVWNRSIAFGPYHTSMVDEGTRRSWLADLDVLQVAKADQGYHLAIGEVAAECHTREIVLGRAGVFVDPTFGGAPLLVCGYDRGGSRSVLTLFRSGGTEPSLRGTLRDASGKELEVRSLHRAAGGSFPSGEPFGYEIVRDGGRVAIVETVNRGRVWIDPATPDREMLAAAAASLLLFRDPEAGEP